MASIKYILVDGIPPITVSITPAVQPNQIRNVLGSYFFANLPDGTYTIRATDITGCWDEITATINCSTTSTTSTSTTCYVGAALNQVVCEDWDEGCVGCYEYLLQNISGTETARFSVITCADIPAIVSLTPTSQLELCLSACMVYPLDDYGIATRTEDCTPSTSTSTSTIEPTTSTSTTVEPTTTTSTTAEPTTTTTTTTIIEPETDYGFLYNWWAAIGDTDGDDVADTSIANTGWHLPSKTEWETLMTNIGEVYALGRYETAGIKLKSTGYDHWLDSGNPDHEGLDSYGFSKNGSGERRLNFQDFKASARPWTSTGGTGVVISLAWEFQIFHNQTYVLPSYASKYYGQAVRLVKDSTTLTHGQTGTYTGNNGITYPTICIGSVGNEQEWLAKDLEETKFRDGSNISYIGNEAGDDAVWAAATSAAYCIYPIP